MKDGFSEFRHLYISSINFSCSLISFDSKCYKYTFVFKDQSSDDEWIEKSPRETGEESSSLTMSESKEQKAREVDQINEQVVSKTFSYSNTEIQLFQGMYVLWNL